ncbi:MAG: DNA polymerase III subunit gamma/tau [bacterium]|nr:DNA polymerase III subunit gamma/tau [bacterium]MDZ4345239.1 DNA polymerase III subunit gamma/tau [Candidatus Binatia bacterium]
MPTLYRQYRPQLFGDLFGQEHITKTLERALETGRVAHAYLFHGPRGTGKTTTARILAKRLNCLKPKGGEPCNKCKLCLAAQNNQNMDIIEIDAASNRGIDDIRALKDGIGTRPSMGKYKVYVIDEVHMLTNEAFTALLKTLEEPVRHAVFILATTEFHKVPETILSRCQVFRFRRATDKELSARLGFLLKQEKREVDGEALEFIIRRSDGCYRDAESLLGQMLTLQDGLVAVGDLTDFLGLPPREMIDQFLTALVRGESAPALAAADDAFARGLDPEQFLQESIVMARDGALDLIKKEKNDAAFVREAAALVRLPLIIRTLIQATQDLAYVPQPMIALHLAIVVLTNDSVNTARTVNTVNTAQPLPDASPFLQNNRKTQSVNNAQPAHKATGIEGSGINLERVKSIWPQLINKVKETNPVASTFLRAMEPSAINGKALQVQAFYALHRNFFEKDQNKQPIEVILRELLGDKVVMRCFMAETGPATSVTVQDKQKKQEQDLMMAVKEAFG